MDSVLEELVHNPHSDELLAAHLDLSRMDTQARLTYAQAMITGEEVFLKPVIRNSVYRWGSLKVLCNRVHDRPCKLCL